MSNSTDSYVPQPMTAHPHYASQADGIRSMMVRERSAIRVFEPQSLVASYDPQPVGVAPDARVLTIKKVAGPAPFVGDPLWEAGFYVWYAAVDDVGRHVAGAAVLEIIARTSARGAPSAG